MSLSSTVPPSGSLRIATFFRPGTVSSTFPSRSRRKWSGITRPATTASPRPQLASITRSSAPLIGLRVNMTPAHSGSSSDMTTTPTLGRRNSPTRCRYVIAESELADHQISRSASGTASTPGTFSSVRCCPAKLASAPSSSTADDRTASGEPSGRTSSATASIAARSPPATASTTAPESATPGGRGSPERAASPSPTAFEP